MDEISSLSSPSCWSNEYTRLGDLKPTNLNDAFGSLDPSMLSPLKGLSVKSATPTQMQSPTAHQIRQNQLRASYSTNLPSSPVRNPSPFSFDSSAAVAATVMNSRSSAFAKRSQSFIDRGRARITAPFNSTTMMSSNISDWSSPNGKLDWGMQGDELNKLRKSASFRFRNNTPAPIATKDMMMPSNIDEPDVSWVNSLMKDVTPGGGPSLQQQYNIGKGVRERLPPWVEQMYIEHEQMVA